MKKIAIAFVTVILFAACEKPQLPRTVTTLILGIEHRQDMIRGWNDITMLIIDRPDRVQVIGFPRDTFAFYPAKGTWLLNAGYLVLGPKGLANWLTYNLKGVKVDHVVAIDIDGAARTADQLSKLPFPKRIRTIFERFKYVQDWARHRHRLRLEADRQRRIQALLAYAVELGKQDRPSRALIRTADTVARATAEYQDFGTGYGFAEIYRALIGKPVEYSIWPGYWQAVDFNLQLSDGHVFFGSPNHYSYFLDKTSADMIQPERNPWRFSYEGFFKTDGPPAKTIVKPGSAGTFIRWRGWFNEDPELLISNYAFTNQDWTAGQIHRFVRTFEKCQITDKQVDTIVAACRKTRLSIWMILAQIQKESSLILNEANCTYRLREGRAMGYDCGTVGTNIDGDPVGRFHGFDNQIRKGTACLRRHYDAFQEGQKIDVYSYEKTLRPRNAATYALYAYTPFYGEAFPHGAISVGNRRFMACWWVIDDRRRALEASEKRGREKIAPPAGGRK